jgi:ketosteroid isomerase-like protein
MNAKPGTVVLERLIDAVNAHDLDALVGQFADDVRSDTPAHPARSFVGREQVRRNWAQILGSIHDLEARLLASTTSPGQGGATTEWAEIAFDGHRPDGIPWQMRGVTVNEVVDERIVALRFYLEPVDDAAVSVGVDEAVRTMTSGSQSMAAGTVR